jgi:ribosomal protein L21E
MRAKTKGKESGKINFSKYFQKLKVGDVVSIKRDPSVASSFSRKAEGKTGRVGRTQGRFCMVKVNEFNAKKEFLIHPVHLEKLKENKK